MTTVRRKGSEAGYSLIEVIIGVGLLSVIAMSIVGLFVQGRKDVQSGKNLTSALSVTQHIAEDLDSLPYTALYQSWSTGWITAAHKQAAVVITKNAGIWKIGIAASIDPEPFDATAASGTIPSGEAPAQAFVDTTTAATEEPLKSLIAAWATQLDTIAGGADVRIFLRPTFDLNDDYTAETGTVAKFEGAAFIRMDISVRWHEGVRVRSVSLPQIRTLNEL